MTASTTSGDRGPVAVTASSAPSAADPASVDAIASDAKPPGDSASDRAARDPARAALLDIRGLRAGYQQGTVLHGVDLAVARGHVVALLGRNGVGKSTLVMTVMGLVRAHGGSVRLGGADLTGRRPDEIARAGIGLVPQGRRIWPNLSVAEHLELARRGAGRSARLRRLDELYQLLPRLAERRRQLAGLLSGGEQQMLAIARALVAAPAVVLLDEPSEGLAPLVVDQIGIMIKTLAAAGTAILLVEQDLHLAFGVADDIAVMARGAIVHRSDTLAFRRDPATAHRLLGIEA